ncbi:Protein root UVB sensitive 5 [Glycine soja]
MEDMEKMKRVRPRGFQFLCSSEHSSFKDEDGADNGGGQVSSRVILVERYSNGTAKRYVLGDDSQLQAFLVEEDRSTPNRFQDSHSSDESLSWLPEIIKDFVLPAGFPGSVSDDYLDYMLLQFPTNVTGWICHTLVTSSLLKDGIGAVGRLFIGGRFGSLFDDDPKQWRMYADFIGSAGSIFDLTTQLYPAYFLPLASLGNLTKAVARGLKDPSFRVIQNHFAISGNLGEVAAKEEVWEVVAQLVGLSLGILILDTPGLVKSYGVISLTWLSMRLLHLWLRYESLSVLQFNTINIKRARILVKSHVLHSTVPGCTDCNREENILAWSQFMKPKIIFGLPLEKMDGVERSYFMVEALIKLYASEKYILMVNQQTEDLRFYVSFKSRKSTNPTLKEEKMSGVKRALRQFTFGTGKTAGRNSAGRITSFHRGGGAKRLQRTVDHKRNTASSLGVVERIEYDPNRSSKIALVRWIEGVHHRRRHAASANAASPKLLHLDPAATDANSIRGVFALNSMLPHAHAGTSSRELFLSALASKAKGSESESVSSLGIPRFAVAAARAPFFAQRAIGEETLEAVARGLKDPSFRVIQNHFAISGNLGEVAAKEEVWEVVAQLVGLSLGILILDTPGLVKSYGVISLTWLSMRLLHLWLRYESLSVLQFNTINIKRARILVKSHVLHSTVPGCTDSNREVNILAWSQFMKPKIIFGLPLEKMDGVERSYFMVGATNVSVLRSVWQSFWLSENWDSDDNVRDQIATSLMELEEKFEDFIQKLKDAEWDTQQFNLKVLVELSYFREVDAHLLAHLSQKARNKWDFMEDSLHKSSDSRSIPTNERMHEQPEPIIVLSRRKSFNEKVVVVSGETGCGKTTQLPQYILESEIEAARGAVLVGAVVL